MTTVDITAYQQEQLDRLREILELPGGWEEEHGWLVSTSPDAVPAVWHELADLGLVRLRHIPPSGIFLTLGREVADTLGRTRDLADDDVE